MKWTIAGAVIAALVALAWIGVAHHWLTLDSLNRHRTALQALITRNYTLALLATLAGSFVLIALSFPLTGVLNFLCGMLFGRWVGTVVIVIAISLGATAAMLLVRYVLKGFVRKRVQAHAGTRKLMQGFHRHQNSYLLFMRLAPGVPMWLSNILLGLTDISAWRFLVLTFIGVIPDCFIYCNVGASLIRIHSLRDLLSPGNIVALCLLALLSLMPVAIHQLERRKLLPEDWPFHRA